MTQSTAETKSLNRRRVANPSLEAMSSLPGAGPDVPPPEKHGPAAEAPPPESEAWRAHGPWGVVLEDIAKLDVQGTYKKLREALVLKEGNLQRGMVANALNTAERYVFEATLLARGSKLEQQRVEGTVEQKLEAMRRKAKDEILKEKKEGSGARAPTKDDVQDRMMFNWPDLHRELERRKEEAHAARAVCDELVDSWKSRCSSLRALLDKVT